MNPIHQIIIIETAMIRVGGNRLEAIKHGRCNSEVIKLAIEIGWHLKHTLIETFRRIERRDSHG